MIGEGLDIPRLAVLGQPSRTAEDLVWRQSAGRALREASPGAVHEVATVFLPAVGPLLDLAGRMEEQRNRVVRVVPGEALEEVVLGPVETGAGSGARFVAPGAEATFAHVPHSGRAIAADNVAARAGRIPDGLEPARRPCRGRVGRCPVGPRRRLAPACSARGEDWRLGHL